MSLPIEQTVVEYGDVKHLYITLTMNVDDRTEAQVILQTIADNVSLLGNTLAEAIGDSFRQARGNMP